MCNELNMSRILEINGMRTPGIFNALLLRLRKNELGLRTNVFVKGLYSLKIMLEQRKSLKTDSIIALSISTGYGTI